MTVNVTQIFRMHPECFDAEARAALVGGDSPFDLAGLRYVSAVEESMALVRDPQPAIIISASGMCEGGRVLHHLRGAIEDRRNTILIVGWQAPHTLGRRLLERRDRVRIFGIERHRAAEVVDLEGLSAHADQADLVAFAESVRARGPLRRVVLVHGEPAAQAALREALVERGFPTVDVPVAGDRIVA